MERREDKRITWRDVGNVSKHQTNHISFLGVICGLAVSVFSKTLTLLLGLLVVGLQTAEYHGIHLIPYNRMQSYFKGIDLRSAVQDNVALKLSFGATFALAGFARI